MCVPDNILAEEDKLQTTQYTEAEFENVRRKLHELQQRAKRVCIAAPYQETTTTVLSCRVYTVGHLTWLRN